MITENWDQYKDLEYYPDRFCACSCGGRIKVHPMHKYHGIPEYISGHNIRTNHPMKNPIFVKKNSEAKLRREIRFCKNPNCSKFFEVCYSQTKQYCSRKCASQDRKENLHKENCDCVFCKIIKKQPHSADCQCASCRSFRGECFGENSPNWQGGTSKLPYPFSFNEGLKEFIRNRDHNTCQLCGRTQEEEGRNLCIHHINYDKDDLFELNLITLCRSCNGKVNANRELWEDSFTFKVYSFIEMKK
jgi:DNA-directed RNA polymerase beta' subunit